MVWDGAAVLFLLLALTAWFAGVPAGVPAWPFLLAAAALALVPRLRAGAHGVWPRPRAETVACLAVALAYRASSLVHPWGWVNRDGAYGAFVTLHLLEGQRPAPVFTEGANYQGTLKPHLAALLALLTGDRDLSRLMAAASLLLSLVFIAASMALARRLGGRAAALATGLYLAVGPRFPTVFLLNCVGQYADVLALGGVALVLLARLLQEELRGREARGAYFAIGALAGAAFWQQPVALAYVIVVALALIARGRTWRDPWTLAVPAGLLVGMLPVVLWNLQNGWATGEILGREGEGVRARAEALPATVVRTLAVSFPILGGLSPGHPWAGWPWVAWAAGAVIPAAVLLFLVVRRKQIVPPLTADAVATLVPPVLMLASLGLFWSIAAGAVHWRPRYLLPVHAATAVHLGVVVAALARRSRPAAAAVLALLLALNAAGFLPRLREARDAQRHYRELVRALERTGIRTGYADFSIAAPVTMFTRERILLSPRLGPTPAYYSPSQEARVASTGPDAFVLRPRDDAEEFARVLNGLGVTFRFDAQPLPIFHSLGRRVPVAEVLEAWGRAAEGESGPE